VGFPNFGNGKNGELLLSGDLGRQHQPVTKQNFLHFVLLF
jgi:hypothetical protein